MANSYWRISSTYGKGKLQNLSNMCLRKWTALKPLLPSSSMKAKEQDLLRVTNWSWPLHLLESDLYFNKSQEPTWEACYYCWDCYLLLFSWPSANIWSSSSTVLFFLSLRAFSTVSFAHGSGALVDGEDSVELITCSRLQWKIRFQHQDILITMPYSTDFSHWTSEANQQAKV